jgi:hypothetical protein
MSNPDESLDECVPPLGPLDDVAGGQLTAPAWAALPSLAARPGVNEPIVDTSSPEEFNDPIEAKRIEPGDPGIEFSDTPGSPPLSGATA